MVSNKLGLCYAVLVRYRSISTGGEGGRVGYKWVIMFCPLPYIRCMVIMFCPPAIHSLGGLGGWVIMFCSSPHMLCKIMVELEHS